MDIIKQAALGVYEIEPETDIASDMQHTILSLFSGELDRELDCTSAADIDPSYAAELWKRDDDTRPMPAVLRPVPPKRFWIASLFSWVARLFASRR